MKNPSFNTIQSHLKRLASIVIAPLYQKRNHGKNIRYYSSLQR